MEFDIKRVKKLSNNIRKHAVMMTSLGGSSHIGSVLSISDILAVLYGTILNFNPKDPKWESRDRFILKKLKTHYQDGSDLSGHVSHKGISGVEFSTGSLGHGLPVGSGMALAAKIDKKDHRIFVLMSDGECDEGSNWEAFLFSSHHKLDNLVVIIDRNRLQSINSTEATLALEPLMDKLVSFGWNVVDLDGHNHEELFQAMSLENENIGKPLCLIANTTKGKGVSFMEGETLWHYRSPQGEEYDAAMKELKEKDA